MTSNEQELKDKPIDEHKLKAVDVQISFKRSDDSELTIKRRIKGNTVGQWYQSVLDIFKEAEKKEKAVQRKRRNTRKKSRKKSRSRKR